MSAGDDRAARRRFPAGTTAEDLKSYMGRFVATLGYKFNTESDFVDEVLASELEILERTGDVYCPCRMRTGDPKEDYKIVCPCIPFHMEQFAAMRKCWCGLFIRTDVDDGAELLGVIEEPEPGTVVEVPVCRTGDVPSGCVRHVKIGKTDIALAKVGDEYYALSNVCRHAFGPLSGGVLDGYELMCPWHGWRYDVRTGATDHPDSDVRTYAVTVRGGEILIVMDVR
jgi:ferredoxin-thioredoxin reductase catalytic chain